MIWWHSFAPLQYNSVFTWLKSIYLYKKSPMMISFNKGKSYLNLPAPMWKSNWLLYLKTGCATLISKTCKSSICDNFQWVIHVNVEEFCSTLLVVQRVFFFFFFKHECPVQTHAEATFDQVVPKNRNFPGGGGVSHAEVDVLMCFRLSCHITQASGHKLMTGHSPSGL